MSFLRLDSGHATLITPDLAQERAALIVQSSLSTFKTSIANKIGDQLEMDSTELNLEVGCSAFSSIVVAL